jgi:diaminohydroxyphosphoribosylaminopyrimidine deaminase/5-amino-6-(5-phosphoribosylamino)uracil reductase
MIEGGGRLHGAFIEEGLADRLVAYVAPVLLGDRGHPVIGFPGPDTLADATRWRVRDVTTLGADVRITLDPPGASKAVA